MISLWVGLVIEIFSKIESVFFLEPAAFFYLNGQDTAMHVNFSFEISDAFPEAGFAEAFFSRIDVLLEI